MKEKIISLHRDEFLTALSRKKPMEVEVHKNWLGEMSVEYKKHLLRLKRGQVIFHLSFNQLLADIKQYLSENFSQEVNQTYRYLVSRKNGDPGSGVKTKTTNRTWAKVLARKHEAQCAYLEQLYDCLNNYGLHPAIEQRDPVLHARYNFMVEYEIIKGQRLVEYVPLMSLQHLTTGFINSYHAGNPISPNGVRILLRHITRLTITSTLLTDDELVLFRQKHNLVTDIDFIRKCKDETNALLFAPPAPIVYPDKMVLQIAPRQQVLQGFVGPTNQPVLPEITELNHALMRCIHELQRQAHRLIPGSTNKKAGRIQENHVRNLFKLGLADRYPAIEAETEQRRGRVDLKINLPDGNKQLMLEFKGWWNRDKKQVAKQMLDYLTDFEQVGVIVIINHLRTKDITTPYQRLIEQQSNGCIPDSWTPITYPGTPFVYYRSEHRMDNKLKILYHFICRL